LFLFEDFRYLRIPACVYFYLRVPCLLVPILHRTSRRLPRLPRYGRFRTRGALVKSLGVLYIINCWHIKSVWILISSLQSPLYFVALRFDFWLCKVVSRRNNIFLYPTNVIILRSRCVLSVPNNRRCHSARLIFLRYKSKSNEFSS